MTQADTQPETAVRIIDRRGEDTPLAPKSLIERAIASNASVEVVERLLALQERWDKSQAKKAFDAAMADVRADLPRIIKNRTVDFTSQKGRTVYDHEDADAVISALAPVLAKVGLSFRYRTEQPDGNIRVTCIVSHRDGHSEETSLTCPTDNSGNKNPIQAIGSAVTYLQRYTLKAAVGVAAAHDDDGAGGPKKPEDTVTDEQAGELSDLFVGLEDRYDGFKKFYNIEKLSELPASKFDQAKGFLVKAKKEKEGAK